MKTAVSIPDPTFAAADELAKELGISRSELYARALNDLIRRRKHDHITHTINEVLQDIETEPGETAFGQRAARRAFEHNEC